MVTTTTIWGRGTWTFPVLAMALPCLWLLWMLGCDRADEQHRQLPVSVVPTAPAPVLAPTPAPAATTLAISSTANPAPIVEVAFSAADDDMTYGRYGPASVDEMIATSPIVVRATLDGVSPVGIWLNAEGRFRDLEWVGSLEFTFTVLEYLKGSGGTQVKAVALGWPWRSAQTEAEAVERARALLGTRDARWDDREAIVFLRLPWWTDDPSALPWLGHVGLFSEPDRSRSSITVADAEFRAWLPDASPAKIATTTQAARSLVPGPGGSSGGQRFLLDDPATEGGEGEGARGASTTSMLRTLGGGTVSATTTESIALATLKARIARMEGRIAAGGGSQAFRDCVATEQTFDRQTRNVQYQRRDGAIESGLLAGTKMITNEELAVIFMWDPDYQHNAEIWYEGRDGDLMAFELPVYTVSTRPLPAGVYRAFETGLADSLAICDGQTPNLQGKLEHVVTVTAPAGTLAESFFDPVTAGDAISATTTVGTIGWEDGEVSATLRIEATGHVLDFIGLTGTTTLSLSVAEAATSTPNTLSWPVASQPWVAGDKLMLRIRAVPPPAASVTVTLSPREEQVSSLTFTYTDILIEWSDPDACDSHYFVGLYEGETVDRIFGFHPAPETTTYSANTQLPWDRISSYDRKARVTCAPSDGSEWRVLGEASLQSGLPSTP